MESRSLLNLYLPARIAYHVKIILASLIIAVIFSYFTSGSLWSTGTIHLIALMIIQLEFFIWLGEKFFHIKPLLSAQKSVKRLIIRLVQFYIIAFIISTALFVLYNFLLYLMHGSDLNLLLPNLINRELKGFLIGASSGYLVGAIFFFYFQWTDALKREQALKEEKLIFQYETLKNQVNPHFLFNSLNTLSSLVSKDANLAEDYINKFSGIYRYILENRSKDVIALSEEIKFARDYFYLQQIRDDGKISLDVDAMADGYEILPISIQILMENALKHNVATRENPLKIRISIDAANDHVILTNNYNPKTRVEHSSKIGLKNLSERIKLSTGKDILIINDGEIYQVKIPLMRKK